MIYADVKLGDGKSLGKCLVDIGAAVNVLTAEKVRELGLVMVKSEVESVKGFDGQDSKVFGQCEVEVKFGPC